MRHWFSAALILILARSGTIIKKGAAESPQDSTRGQGHYHYLFIYLFKRKTLTSWIIYDIKYEINFTHDLMISLWLNAAFPYYFCVIDALFISRESGCRKLLFLSMVNDKFSASSAFLAIDQ